MSLGNQRLSDSQTVTKSLPRSKGENLNVVAIINQGRRHACGRQGKKMWKKLFVDWISSCSSEVVTLDWFFNELVNAGIISGASRSANVSGICELCLAVRRDVKKTTPKTFYPSHDAPLLTKPQAYQRCILLDT
ncbi:hypothetical protein BgiBS90_030102 [Biomphalaria glabrata]|nr:hypothetical protein BgiBS90_030102 [Biomphalaria glabrata]